MVPPDDAMVTRLVVIKFLLLLAKAKRAPGILAHCDVELAMDITYSV